MAAAANPFDQFDATPAAASGGGAQANPFDQFDAKAAPAKTAPGPPQSMLHDIGNEIDSAVTLGGADWLTSKLPGAPSLQDLQTTTQASHARLPTAVSAPIDVAGYAMGPVQASAPPGRAALGGAGIGGWRRKWVMAGGLSGGFSSATTIRCGRRGTPQSGAGLGALAGLVPAGINVVSRSACGASLRRSTPRWRSPRRRRIP